MELTASEDIPYSLDEVSAEWLTKALRHQGLIDDAEVTDVQSRTIGEVEGFNGDVAILSLRYSVEDCPAPDSMVIKIPTASKNRIMGQTMGLYEKEIRFYRDLQPEMNVRVPKHYYSAIDAFDEPDVVLERLEGLNSLPVGLVRVLTRALTWFVRMTPRRYVLLIEDLSGCRMGDQMATYSDEELTRILTDMAKLHAQFWDTDSFKQMTWIQPMRATSRIIQGMFLGAAKQFRKIIGADVSPEQHQLLNWLVANGVELTETLGQEPPTLLHGDFRLDNLCFDDEVGEVVLMDWQTLQNGPAGLELAYFLSAALPKDASDEKIQQMIQIYHDAINANGIDISLDRLRWQYEAGMLAMLHRILPAMFQGDLELGDGRGREVIQAWIDKIFLRVRSIDHLTVLSRAPQQGS